MYKKQMTFQRIVCLLAVIAGALVFVYSLGFSTDLSDGLAWTNQTYKEVDENLKPVRRGQELTFTDAYAVYEETQDFNKVLTYAGIGMILLGASLFIAQTHVRRRYYIANYVTTGFYAVAALGVTGWTWFAIHSADGYKNAFLNAVMDQPMLELIARANGKVYTNSTFWLDAQYVVAAVLILTTVLLLVNLAWKLSLMSTEAKLIKQAPAA